MSSATADAPRPPDEYTGDDQYVDWAEDYLDVTLTAEQREILRGLKTEPYLQVEGANSFGKTFALVCGALAFYFSNFPSAVITTSGTYGKLKRTFCDPIEHFHTQAQHRYGIPGEWKWSPNPHLDVDSEPMWQFEVHSPKDPGELEGVHSTHTLAIVEEADKEDVTAEVIDSMESVISDENDRLLVVNNPPTDESNVVHELATGDKYTTLRYSSFDSHNVKLETGQCEGEPVPGLATLQKLKDDWKDYNGLEWPGWEAAERAHRERDDLDVRWYRRRAGVMPPASAGQHRPFYTQDVRQAVEENETPPSSSPPPIAVGIDVARKGGDETVVSALYETHVTFEAWGHRDHKENFSTICDIVDDFQQSPPIAVDAVGEGSGLADNLREAYADVTRFKAGEKAADEDEWYNRWTEGLDHLGQRLPRLAVPNERTIREELFTAARVVTYEEKRRRSGDVLKATPKSDIKERLDRSPDHLDALVMAAWAADSEPGDTTERKTINFSW